MADAETANPAEDTVPEGQAAGNAESTEEPAGEKEANKTASPKPDQDPGVAPPLITVTKGNSKTFSRNAVLLVKLNQMYRKVADKSRAWTTGRLLIFSD